MALIINGIERQTVSIGGTEFKNLGGGGKGPPVVGFHLTCEQIRYSHSGFKIN